MASEPWLTDVPLEPHPNTEPRILLISLVVGELPVWIDYFIHSASYAQKYGSTRH